MNANVIWPPRKPRTGRFPLVLLLRMMLALLMMTPAMAPAGADAPSDAAADARCEWGCVRWGRQCSVDPRGVRRCRRSCEKFAQVCPPDADEPAPAEPSPAPSP